MAVLIFITLCSVRWMAISKLRGLNEVPEGLKIKVKEKPENIG